LFESMHGSLHFCLVILPSGHHTRHHLAMRSALSVVRVNARTRCRSEPAIRRALPQSRLFPGAQMVACRVRVLSCSTHAITVPQPAGSNICICTEFATLPVLSSRLLRDYETRGSNRSVRSLDLETVEMDFTSCQSIMQFDC